jgi:hypothetical protein
MNKSSKGTPEQMLAAFENKINELEGNTSVESATQIGSTVDKYCTDCDSVTSQTYKGKTNSGDEDMYICTECGCENYEVAEDIESVTSIEASNDDTLRLINRLYLQIKNKLISEGYDDCAELDDYASGAAELIYYAPDDYTVDQWYDDTLENYREDLEELPKSYDNVDSATDITAANETEDSEYIEKLSDSVETILGNEGVDVVVEVSGDYLVISDTNNPDINYLESLDNIEPIIEDIDDDAQQLADAFMEKYSDVY